VGGKGGKEKLLKLGAQLEERGKRECYFDMEDGQPENREGEGVLASCREIVQSSGEAYCRGEKNGLLAAVGD